MQLFRTFITLAILLGFTQTSTLAVNIPLNISATVLSKSQCKFNTKNGTIDFGQLDPGAAVDVNGSAFFDFTCVGNAPIATYLLSIDDGLHSLAVGSPRMQHTTDLTAFMPYSLTLTPSSGSIPKKAVATLRVDASLPAASYAVAPVGIFNDTVTITLLP